MGVPVQLFPPCGPFSAIPPERQPFRLPARAGLGPPRFFQLNQHQFRRPAVEATAAGSRNLGRSRAGSDLLTASSTFQRQLSVCRRPSQCFCRTAHSFIRRRGPWTSFEAVEYATLEWIGCSINRRLLAPIGRVRPAKAQARLYAAWGAAPITAYLTTICFRQTRCGSIRPCAPRLEPDHYLRAAAGPAKPGQPALRLLKQPLGQPQLRMVPSPVTRYLKLVSCSAPTGPRACILPVAMPISAPMPNSPPSANCVEALRIRMALSKP